MPYPLLGHTCSLMLTSFIMNTLYGGVVLEATEINLELFQNLGGPYIHTIAPIAVLFLVFCLVAMCRYVAAPFSHVRARNSHCFNYLTRTTCYLIEEVSGETSSIPLLDLL